MNAPDDGRPPRWLLVLAIFCNIVFPLCLLAGAIYLFALFGATWALWLVLALVIVMALLAKPRPPFVS